MSNQAFVDLFEKIFAQCDNINTFFNKGLAQKKKDEPCTDEAKKQLTEMVAQANINLAKAVDHVEGLDIVELTLSDCSVKYTHQCDTIRLAVGWLVLTLRGDSCRMRQQLITQMATHHEIRYDNKPAHTAVDKAIRALYSRTGEIYMMIEDNDLEDFMSQAEAIVKPKVDQANIEVAKIIKDVDGLDSAVMSFTDGKTEEPKDTAEMVTLTLGGAGAPGLWITLHGQAAEDFATKMREDAKIRCVQEIETPHV